MYSLEIWVISLALFIAKTRTAIIDSSENRHPYIYNFLPLDIQNFDDDGFNELGSTNTEETTTEALIVTTDIGSTIIAEETPTHANLPLPNYNSINSQLVEFRAEIPTTQTIPPPKYIINSKFVNDSTTVSPTDVITTEDQDEMIKVVPIKKIDQRGVLDLLFPETRVKSFKSLFNSLGRLLSHTFRR